MKEINLKNYNHYLIDTNGNVYSTQSARGNYWKNGIRKLKSFPNKNTGYHQIILQNKKCGLKPKLFYVHRLVAITYIPNPLNKKEINHIIPNKNDNSVGNLEWVTKEENKLHEKYFGNRIQKYETKYDRIIKNTKLLNKGIDIFKKTNDWNKLNKIWNCSKILSMKIIDSKKIKRKKYKISSL